MDISTVLGHNTDHRCHPDSPQHHRPRKSVWPLVTAETQTCINTFGINTACRSHIEHWCFSAIAQTSSTSPGCSAEGRASGGITNQSDVSRRPNPENELFSVSDIHLLPRARVIMQLGSVFRSRAYVSSRALPWTLLNNDMPPHSNMVKF